MKILIIGTSSSRINTFPGNNYNEQETGMIRAFGKLGHRCDVAFYSDNKESCKKVMIGEYETTVYNLKGFDLLRTVVYKDYRSIYETYDILMPISYDHYETYHIAMMYPEKTVVYNGTYYSSFNKRYNLKCAIFDRFILPGYRKNNTFFATKNKLSAEFLNKKGLTNTHIVGVGLDVAQFKGTNDINAESKIKDEIIKEKEKGTKILLYIGKIEPRRNTTFLIDVFNEVQKHLSVKFVLIGDGNKEYKDKVAKKINEYGIKDKIIYKDRIEQKFLPPIYQSSDAFLLPTSYEIFGMVILEAMYFGTPVISTLNGGSDILIEDGKTGYIVPNLDITNWSHTLIRVLQNKNYELIKAANKRIVEEFTWDSLVLKFLKIFEKRLSGK